MPSLSPQTIRALRAEKPTLRERDFAEQHNISEAQLIAAFTPKSATRIASHPDQIIGAAQQLGEVMALTRTASCVHEKVGAYDDYHAGEHASMVLNEDIDLRIFPKHWCHAFAVEKETDKGLQRSLQVFDAAGDAVHKIFMRATSNDAAWAGVKEQLAHSDQSETLLVDPRQPVEAAKSNPDKTEILRTEWAKLTDTHQFLRLCSKLKMNRLGAYRSAGQPFVRQLRTTGVNDMLLAVQEAGIEIMVFVGNKGCIQIHNGPIETLREMGPWQNVMDPRFNLHLRLDHIAEVWAVEKPTQRGPAISIEAFDKDGALILQTFGLGKKGRDYRAHWGQIVASMPALEAEAMA
ncbi:MAG: ChuX/HutX family heme-like substrate-binding protein [Sulfitobacter sp.]